MKQGEDHAPCAVEACWKMSFSPKCILEYKMCRPLKVFQKVLQTFPLIPLQGGLALRLLLEKKA